MLSTLIVICYFLVTIYKCKCNLKLLTDHSTKHFQNTKSRIFSRVAPKRHSSLFLSPLQIDIQKHRYFLGSFGDIHHEVRKIQHHFPLVTVFIVTVKLTSFRKYFAIEFARSSLTITIFYFVCICLSLS